MINDLITFFTGSPQNRRKYARRTGPFKAWMAQGSNWASVVCMDISGSGLGVLIPGEAGADHAPSQNGEGAGEEQPNDQRDLHQRNGVGVAMDVEMDVENDVGGGEPESELPPRHMGRQRQCPDCRESEPFRRRRRD